MADYQLTAATEPCAVIRASDGACIPPDMANRDYNGDQFSPGYVQWKAAGKPMVELRQRVEELQQVARQYGAIIGITGYGSTSEAALEAIGMGAARRLWFNLGDGLPASRIVALAALLRG